ncbi:MAG: DUF502 domain-containing protein [Candidatus Omnitrophota bacterium]
MKTFRKIKFSFFTGLLMMVPLVLTAWVLYFIVARLNAWFLEPIMNILGRWLSGSNVEFLTKVVIFFILLSLLTLIGFAARILFIKKIMGSAEKMLYKVPLISTIYGGLKEISSAFFDKDRSLFQRVVLVEYPRKGIYVLGFVTSDAEGEVQQKTKEHVINIFLPTTPNPTSGMLVLVPREDVIDLEMSVAEGMKMIISGGAVNPQRIGHGDTKDGSGPSEKEGS